MPARLGPTLLLLPLVLAGGCHEELGVGAPAAQMIEVEKLTFVGVESIDESALRRVLATRETPWLPWSDTQYFDRDDFEEDLARIEAFYADRGYPEAEVVSYDVDLDEAENRVSLRVTIAEGEPLRVAEIILEHFDVGGGDVREEVRSQIPLKPGEPLVYQQLVTSGEMAATVLKNRGYPFAQVRIDRQPRPSGVAVVLRAEPGELSVFGPIEVVGNYSVDDEIIRRQLVFRPGEIFRRSAVRESLRQLYALELFEFANVEIVDADRTSGSVPTRVTVAEGDHRRLEFSVGYGTEEKGRVEAEWRHVNFYGGARTLAAHAKWSWLDRGVEGTFVQPYLFSPSLSLSLQGQAWYADEPAFTALSRGGRTTVTHAAGPDATVSGYLTYQFQSSRIQNEALRDPALRDDLIALGLDPTTGVQDGALVALGANAQIARVDSTLDPTAGYLASAGVEAAGGAVLPGEYNYFSGMSELRGYYTPRARVTLAARARYGSIAPYGPPSDVPFFKRFFLGGASSLRGYGRFEVSPLSGSGLPIGGNSLLESSLEVRTRIWGNVGLVAFVDAGNVWRDAWAFAPGDLLYSAGPGLRYTTPIGPVRLDLAYQLNPLEGLRIDGELQERPWRIHFSIGQAF